jgi:hypothetical protein
MKSLSLALSCAVLAWGMNAQAAVMLFNINGQMTVQSTAIVGNWDSACASKGADTEKLIASAEQTYPELKGTLGQSSEVDPGGVTQDCLYYKHGFGVLCSASYTVQSCFTTVSVYSEKYELAFHEDTAPVDFPANTVYSEIDHGSATWVTVELK